MSAPATIARKAAQSAQKRADKKPYSRPMLAAVDSLTTAAEEEAVYLRVKQKKEQVEMKKQRLEPKHLASELRARAENIDGVAKMLETPSGQQDLHLRAVALWYLDKIEALEQQTVPQEDQEEQEPQQPPPRQTFEDWREQALTDHNEQDQDHDD